MTIGLTRQQIIGVVCEDLEASAITVNADTLLFNVHKHFDVSEREIETFLADYSPPKERRGRPSQHKIHVGFTVDRDVAKKLQEIGENKSQFVNTLFRQYFGIDNK